MTALRSPLLALLHREWRNARTMTLVFVVLVPIAGWASVEMTGQAIGFCEVATVVYGLALASDLVAGERDARLEGLALLPAEAAQVWTAKALFLAAMMTVFSLWAHLIAIGATLVLPSQQPTSSVLAHVLDDGGQLHVLVLAAASICLLFSTVVQRGIAALFLTALTAGAIGGAGQVLARDCLVPNMDEALYVVWPWLLVLVACAAGSALAFVRGGVSRGVVVRPWLLAAAPPMILVVLPTVAVGYAGYRAADFDYSDPQVSIYHWGVSHDGRWIAVTCQRRTAFLGARYATWVVDVETGNPRAMNLRNGHGREWLADGRLAVMRVGDLDFEDTQNFVVDPADPGLAVSPWAPPDRPSCGANKRPAPSGDVGQTAFDLHVSGGGLPPTVVQTPFRYAFVHGETLLYWRDRRHLVLRNVTTEEERAVLETVTETRQTWMNRQGHHVAVEADHVWHLFDLASRAILSDLVVKAVHVSGCGRRYGSAWFLVQETPAGEEPATWSLVCADSGERRRVPVGAYAGHYFDVAPLPGGVVATGRSNNSGIDVFTQDGEVVRTLFETGGTR